VVLSALSCDPNDRFPDARSMAEALLDAAPPVRDCEVDAWVTARAHDELRRRGELVIELENVRLSEIADLPRRASRSVVIPGPAAISDAPPSGYAVGQNEPSATPTNEVEVHRHHVGRRYMILGAGLVVFAVMLGGSYLASSRHPVSGTWAAEGSAQRSIDARPRVGAELATPAPSPPPPSSSEPSSSGLAKRSSAPAFDAKGGRRGRDAGSWLRRRVDACRADRLSASQLSGARCRASIV
jgi:hypothetical protein